MMKMTPKTLKDLKNAKYPKGMNFDKLVECLRSFEQIIDRGRLAEFYCKLLVGFDRVTPFTAEVQTGNG